MSLLQNIKRNYPDHLRTVVIGENTIKFILGDSHYGVFITQWEINGNDIAPVKSKYTGNPIIFACCNGLIGERPFNRSIKLECLYQAIGWEDKIIQIEKEVEAEKMAEIHKVRPDANAEDYDFTFAVGQKLDQILIKMAREQKILDFYK